jgi:hypothetical protein
LTGTKLAGVRVSDDHARVHDHPVEPQQEIHAATEDEEPTGGAAPAGGHDPGHAEAQMDDVVQDRDGEHAQQHRTGRGSEETQVVIVRGDSWNEAKNAYQQKTHAHQQCRGLYGPHRLLLHVISRRA